MPDDKQATEKLGTKDPQAPTNVTDLVREDIPEDGKGTNHPESALGSQPPEDKDTTKSKKEADKSKIPDSTEDDNESQPRPELGINAKAVDANNFIAIGQLINQRGTVKEDEGDRLLLHPLPLELRKKIKAVFVPPVRYEHFIEDIREKGTVEQERLFIVWGPENAGKFTCAVQVALDLLGTEAIESVNIQLYRRTSRDSLSLLALANHSDLQENTVYILQDAFANNVELVEFSASYLSVINRGLQKRKAHLILTTEEIPQLDSLAVPRLSAVLDKEGLARVLKNHLERYGSYAEQVHVSQTLIELVKEHMETLLNEFQTPSQIDRFCHELSRLSIDADKEALLALAKRVLAADHISARLWFQELEQDNARLYAMLVVLFPGVTRFTLDELYTRAVKRLRQDGVSNLSDPREIGLDDMLDLIQASETEEGRISFENQLLEQEANRQLRNHHHLLWSLIDYFLKLIVELKAPEHWEIRRDLGAAIGRLGIYHPHKLRKTLYQLANHESGGVVAAAGYALDAVSRSHLQKRSFVIEILREWVQSGDQDLMWAVGVSFWRVYGSFAELTTTDNKNDDLEGLWAILTKFGKTFNEFNDDTKRLALARALEIELEQEDVHLNRNIDRKIARRMQEYLQRFAFSNLQSILHAIRQISQEHGEDVVKCVIDWLQAEPGSNLHVLGQTTCYQLFTESARASLLVQERYAPLLKLVHPALSIKVSFPEEEENIARLFQSMFVTLRNWLDVSNEWQEQIYETLLMIVNRADSLVANRLRAYLSDIWVDSSSQLARKIGQSLLARSYLIDGMPTMVPGTICGAVALDASKEAQRNQISARLGRRIYSRFESQIEIYVLQMGIKKAVVVPGQSVSSSLLQMDHSHPRLLYSPFHYLKECCPAVNFLMVTTWGKIVDLEDIKDAGWSSPLILVCSDNSVECDWETYQSVSFDPQHIHDPKGMDETLTAVETLISAHIAQAVASLEAADWIDALSRYFEDDALQLDFFISKLDTWIRELDLLSSNREQIDTARKILSVILWLATIDLKRCVELLLSWIYREKEEMFMRMAVTGSSALYRLYGEVVPPPSVPEYEVLLTLLPHLSHTAYRWDILRVVLHAVRKWSVQSEWTDRLSMQPDGSPGELLELIDNVPTQKAQELLSTLDKWTTQKGNKTETIPKSVQKLGERLRLRVALGQQQALPELADGHVYGLIVVDTSEPNRQMREQFTEIALKVIKRFNKLDYQMLHLLVYRIGQSFPIAGSGDEPVRAIFLPPGFGRRPSLINPILELHQYEQVAFLLLLANQPALDEEDWCHTHWNERVMVYSQIESPAWAKKFTCFAWQQSLEDATNVIVQNLSKKLGE